MTTKHPAQHHVHEHHHCCSGHNCGKCDCCKEKATTKTPTSGGADPWLWILATILSLALAGVLAFWLWQCLTAPLPSEPFWCEKGYDEEQFTGPSQTASKSPGQTAVGVGAGFPDLFGKGPGTAPGTLRDWWLERSPDRVPGSDKINIDVLHRATELAIAEADGSPVAGLIRSGLPMTPEESTEAPYDFWNEGDKDGVLGFYRLGLTFLGADAFKFAKESSRDERLYVPFCPKSRFVPFHNMEFAYIYLVIGAQQCQTQGKPDAQAWLDAIQRTYPERESEFSKWEDGAPKYFDELMRKHGLDPEEPRQRAYFCLGVTPNADDDNGGGRRSCDEATKSRQALKYGDAAFAEGAKEKARACWRKAIDLATESPDGAPPVDPEGATAAILAQKRLQAHETTCKWTPDSLAAISRDYKARSGDLIHVKVLQQALKSLGHYDGQLDGELTPQTRAAIRKYQREREEDETDTLTPEQIVTLICNAAEGAGDVVAQTTLGIMYATGLGVVQNMDQAQYWLTLASTRHNYPDATYNLAVLFGTGIILDSYRLCDVPRSPEQADKYLQEASTQGHPIAMALMKRYGPGSTYASLSARERWALIELQQLENSTADKTGLYAHRIAPIGTKCAPDRATR